MNLKYRYVIGAVLLHVALFLFIFVSAHFGKTIEPPAVIEAVFVQSPRGHIEKAPVQQPIEQEKLEEQKAALKKLQKQKLEQQKLAQEQKQQQEQQKIEQQKKAEELQVQKQAELQRKKAEDEAHQKIVEQQKLLKQQQEEQARQEKAAQDELKRQADEEIKRIAAEKLKQRQAQERKRISDLQAQMDSEQNARLAAARHLRQQTWADMIAAAVRRNWLRPLNSPDTFQCKVKVQLLPGGSVVSAKVVESCGNAALDQSVETAVLKSDPLPMPANPDDFDRNLTFIFQPQDN
ncbi:MAG: cell envelope integrity protein TolA [Stenotrophobium sp.]